MSYHDPKTGDHLPQIGEQVWVYWGRFGKCVCKIHHIGKDGRVWAVRWRRPYRQYTTSPQVIELVTYWEDPSVKVWERVSE